MELKYDHLTRQLDLIPVSSLNVKVNVVGCGAIGSFAVLALAKMGITNIEVWDMDTVSVENMSNQFFRFSDIGKNKAAALKELVKDFTGVEIKAHEREFIEGDVEGMRGVLISAVDSMSVRKLIYRATITKMNYIKYIIDPRMSAEYYQQSTVCMKKHEWYAKTMYTDTEAVQERCTAKSTIYTATLSAGLIAKSIKNIICNEEYPKTIMWDIKSNQPKVIFGATV